MKLLDLIKSVCDHKMDNESGCLATTKDEFRLQNFSLANCDENDFLYTQWSSMRRFHIVYRAALLLYCVIWMGVDLANSDCDGKYFYYLSNWAQFVAVIYLGAAFLFSIRLKLRGLQSFVWGTFNVFVTIAIGISIASLVGQDHVYSEMRKCPFILTIHVHVIIAVIALCDVIVSKISVRLLHVYLSVIFSTIYVIFTLLLHRFAGISNIYPEYLDWATAPGQAAVTSLLLLFLGCPALQLFVYGVYRARVFVFSKCCERRDRSVPLATISGALHSNGDIISNT